MAGVDDEMPGDDFLDEDLPAEEEENAPVEEEEGPTTAELLLWRAQRKRGARRQRLGKPPIQYEDEEEAPDEAPGQQRGAPDVGGEDGKGISERQADEMISLLKDIVTAQEEQITAIQDQTGALEDIATKLENLGKFGN